MYVFICVYKYIKIHIKSKLIFYKNEYTRLYILCLNIKDIYIYNRLNTITAATFLV